MNTQLTASRSLRDLISQTTRPRQGAPRTDRARPNGRPTTQKMEPLIDPRNRGSHGRTRKSPVGSTAVPLLLSRKHAFQPRKHPERPGSDHLASH